MGPDDIGNYTSGLAIRYNCDLIPNQGDDGVIITEEGIMARSFVLILGLLFVCLPAPASAADGQSSTNGAEAISARMKIGYSGTASLGSTQSISVTIQASDLEMGGFDFLIAYDASALTCNEAQPGDLLDTCDWEYFTYRKTPGDCGDPNCSGLVRLIALAETPNGPPHPPCYGPPDTDPHELARIQFTVTGDRTYEGMYIPVQFFWGDCGDNSLSSVSGSSLYIDRAIYDFEDNIIWNEEDDVQFPEDARTMYLGTPDSCIGEKRLACGDANGDGSVNIGDAVFIINYIFKGGSAPNPLAAGDANGDGFINIGDAVHLINYIFKSGPEPKCPGLTRLIEYQNGGISINIE